MKYVLSHTSALYALNAGYINLDELSDKPADEVRILDQPPLCVHKKRRMDVLPEYSLRAASQGDVAELLGQLGHEAPLHVMVPSIKKRGSRKDVCFHAWRGKGVRPLISVSDHVAVCRPELCFVQMCASVSFAEALLLGYELCGYYSTLAEGPEGGLYQRRPLTTAAALQRFIGSELGIDGIRQARKVVPFIADGAASPREAMLCLRLTLPYRYGGYGLPVPRMNDAVAARGKGASGGRELRCDLRWPEANVALEYDSRAHHESEKDRSRDAQRRISLLPTDTVLTVTPRQLESIQCMDEIAAVLARRLGHRLQMPRTQEYRDRKTRLSQELFRAERRSS